MSRRLRRIRALLLLLLENDCLSDDIPPRRYGSLNPHIQALTHAADVE